MQRIAWGGEKIEAFVELFCHLIFGMNHQGTNSGDICGLQSP